MEDYRKKFFLQNIIKINEGIDRLSGQERQAFNEIRKMDYETLLAEHFNTVASIALALDTRESYKKLERIINHPFDCPKCKQSVVWIGTHAKKHVLVDGSTYSGETLFKRGKHTVHWDVCDYALPVSPRVMN